jgi:hypothetical protein
MRVGYLVAAAAVVAAVPLGLLWLDDAMGRAARERSREEGVCYCPDPLARPDGATKAQALALGVVALLGARSLLRAVRR